MDANAQKNKNMLYAQDASFHNLTVYETIKQK